MKSKKEEKVPEPPCIPSPPPAPQYGQKIPSTVHTTSKDGNDDIPRLMSPWKIGDRIQVLPIGPENKFFPRELSPSRKTTSPRKNKVDILQFYKGSFYLF